MRRYIDQFRCIDTWREVFYAKCQLIGNLWYLYNQSGYVSGTYAREDIVFITNN